MVTKSLMNPAQLMMHQLRIVNYRSPIYPPQNNELLSYRLKIHRRRLKLTMLELAAFTGDKLGTLTNWYYEHNVPNKKEYDRVMNILDIAEGIV